MATDGRVLAPRELLLAARSELAGWSGHWAVGLSRSELIVQHDQRMRDGSCCTCVLLVELDQVLKETPDG